MKVEMAGWRKRATGLPRLEAYLYLSEFPVRLPLPENQLGLWAAIQFGLLGFVVYAAVFVAPLG